MRHTIQRFTATIAGFTLIGAAIATSAAAQETGTSYFTEPVRAPTGAVELKVGTAYTQGFGNVAPGRGIDSIAGAGIGLGLDVDYRLTPWLSVGFEGQYQSFTAAQNAWARGLATNVGATYHFVPYARIDPWMRVGTGYRLLWENNPDGVSLTQLRHGFEILTAKIGYDVRLTPDLAIAPVIGADLTLFLWENPSTAPLGTMSSGQVATFLYGGLQARFDIGGSRDSEPSETFTAAPGRRALPRHTPETTPAVATVTGAP